MFTVCTVFFKAETSLLNTFSNGFNIFQATEKTASGYKGKQMPS